MKNLKKLTLISGGQKLIIILAFILQVLILANILLFSDSLSYGCKTDPLIANRIIFVISTIACLILIFKFAFLQRILNFRLLNFGYFFLFANVVLFVVQFIITLNIYFFTGWDVYVLHSAVYELIYNQGEIRHSYFSYYPNNLNLVGILFIIEILFSRLGLNGYHGWLLVSNLFVNVSGVFTFLSVKILTKKISIALITWVVFVIIVALSPWITIPYSDTYSILFPILALYLYISRNPSTRNYLRWFFICFLCLFGYTIKPSVIIILISIIIVELLNLFNDISKRNILNKLFYVIILAISFVPVFLINSTFNHLLKIKVDENLKMTHFHYIMMGLNDETSGIYNREDVLFTRSFKTVDERNAANISVIKERLANYGLLGFIKHSRTKALINFSDGSFAWNCEGNFYYNVPQKEGQVATIFRNIFYQSGSYHQYWLSGVQFIWFLVLSLMFGIVFSMNESNNLYLVVVLSIIGISSFVMLFEARARYLFTYSPLFIIGAGIGFHTMVVSLDTFKDKINHWLIK